MICPICETEMVAARWQCEDASGWAFGWACDCTAEMRDAQDEYDEIIVHSGVAEEIVKDAFGLGGEAPMMLAP